MILQDDFNGDNAHLIRSIEALISLSDDGAMKPHRLGGHARGLLASAAVRLRSLAAEPVGSSYTFNDVSIACCRAGIHESDYQRIMAELPTQPDSAEGEQPKAEGDDLAISLAQIAGAKFTLCGEQLPTDVIGVLRMAADALSAAPQPESDSGASYVHPDGDHYKNGGVWPFVESPGEFADRMRQAYIDFNGDWLAAVRNVLIENRPTLSTATQPEQPARDGETHVTILTGTYEEDGICDGCGMEVAECTGRFRDCQRRAKVVSISGQPKVDSFDYGLIADMLCGLVYNDGFGMNAHGPYTWKAIKEQIDLLEKFDDAEGAITVRVLPGPQHPQQAAVYQCPRCATSLEVDPTAKPQQADGGAVGTVIGPSIQTGNPLVTWHEHPAPGTKLYAAPPKSPGVGVDDALINNLLPDALLFADSIEHLSHARGRAKKILLAALGGEK